MLEELIPMITIVSRGDHKLGYIRVTVKREVKLEKRIKLVDCTIRYLAQCRISKALTLLARERTPILTSSYCVLDIDTDSPSSYHTKNLVLRYSRFESFLAVE